MFVVSFILFSVIFPLFVVNLQIFDINFQLSIVRFPMSIVSFILSIVSFQLSDISFHRIGPLGRFGLVVAMCICLYVYMSPSHAIFFEASHWPTGHMTRSQASHWSKKVYSTQHKKNNFGRVENIFFFNQCEAWDLVM